MTLQAETTCLGQADWCELFKSGNLAAAIEAYVRAFDYVTFAELVRYLEPHADVRGDLAIISNKDPNITIWMGLSTAFVDALAGLLKQGRMHYAPASLLTYMIDGAFPVLPIAKRPPKRGYKDPHWLPVCLRPGET